MALDVKAVLAADSALALTTARRSGKTDMNMSFDGPLAGYIEQSLSQFNLIPAERKAALEQVAAYVGERISAGQGAHLTFICTHNSRRSHMSQIWAQTGAQWYGVPSVHTYSGGTEATAFNPRAVAALTRAGFEITTQDSSKNPVYNVRMVADGEAMTAFSKVYNQPPNPAEQYCAVMTCSSADAACPIVFGSDRRVSVTYEDPKDFDGTANETAAYDERCRQISREMLYLFSRVEKGE